MMEYIKQNLSTIIIFGLLIAYILYQRIPIYISNSKMESKSVENLIFHTLNNQTIYLHELKNKTIVLNFWATWCLPCKAEMPLLNSIYQELKSEGLEVIGITNEKKDIVEHYLKDKEISYIIALDPQYQLAEYFQIQGYPTLIIIKNNTIIDISTGLNIFLKWKIRWYVKRSLL